MKRRIFTLIMALIIALTQASALANAVPTDHGILLSTNDTPYFYSYAWIKGETYSIYNRLLYKLNKEKSEFEAIAKIMDGNEEDLWPDFTLTSDNDELIIVKRNPSLSFNKVQIDGKKATLKPAFGFEFVDTKKLEVGIYEFAICQDKIFASAYGENTGNHCLLTIDKKTGQATKTDLTDVYPAMLKPYKDNSCFFIKESGVKTIVTFDGTTITDKVTYPAGAEGVGNVLYDKKRDSFVLLDKNFAYILTENNELKKAAFLDSREIGNSSISFIDEETIMFPENEEISLIKLDPEHMPADFLRIAGIDDNRQLRRYNKLNPTKPAISVPGFMSTNEAAKAMKDPATAADLYFMETQNDLAALYKHEYIVPLDGSAKVMEAYNRMYPYVKNAISFDGKPYLFPYNVYGYGGNATLLNYAYNTEAFKELGLTENDVPKTYIDFLNFIDKWQKQISPDHNEMTFVPNMAVVDMRTEIMNRILNTNSLYYASRNEIPSYDNPTMQALFDKLAKTDFYGFYNPKEQFEWVNTGDKKAIFTICEDVVDIPEGYVPMPLKIAEDYPLINSAVVTVIGINSLSEKKDLAMNFIEFIIDDMRLRTKTLLYSDLNEPVIDKIKVKEVERYEKMIEDTKKEIDQDKASGGKRTKPLEEKISDMSKYVDYAKKHMYTITREELDWYKANVPSFIILNKQVFDFKSEQISTLYNRFYEKNIEPKNFLMELDHYIRMMTMEGN